MNEKELTILLGRIAETVKNSGNTPQAAVEELLKLLKETEKGLSNTNPEYYNVATTIYEAIGDIWLKAKSNGLAEKAYLDMMKMAVKLYELDKEKYDYRLGFAYYRRADFYRKAIQCAALSPTPKKLDDTQRKMFEMTEGLYKNAVACTMENAKKGIVRYVDLHASVMSELMVLYAAVGDYKNAVACGKDGIKLDKAVYEKMDDKAHSFRLANRMNALAAVYMYQKNAQFSMETLEDAIYVLEEHESEDEITFGVMLARNYLNLASCYSSLPEEAMQAGETYQKGLKRMIEVNQKTQGKLVNDVITSYMVVGDYYRRIHNVEMAKVHYQFAMKQVSELYAVTKNPMYENLMNRLKVFLQE